MEDKIIVFVDNEGPCTRNDNAFESMVAAAEFCGLGKEIGTKVFKRFSNIDDIWGDFRLLNAIDPTYSSGHTLKVILSFLKAMGCTSQWLYGFAKKNIRIVPNIDLVLQNLSKKYNVLQVSTSYEFFIEAFCHLVGFDFKKTHCTIVKRFDEITITKKERKLLLNFMKEVAEMPIIEYNHKTGEVISEHRVFYERITSFIWHTVYKMSVGAFLREVHPVGQAQKLEIVISTIKKLDIPSHQVIYIGDSQTDAQCVKHINENGGLAMVFNGKGRVCNLSNLMYIGEDARAIEEVVTRFAIVGRKEIIDFYTPCREAVFGGLIAAVTSDNIEEFKEMSVKKRKEFRGVHIGELT